MLVVLGFYIVLSFCICVCFNCYSIFYIRKAGYNCIIIAIRGWTTAVRMRAQLPRPVPALGLSTRPLMSFSPLKDPFCPFSIKGQGFQQIVLYSAILKLFHTDVLK